MTVSVVDDLTNFQGGNVTATGAIAVTLPPDLETGDLVIVSIGVWSDSTSTSSWTVPSGWKAFGSTYAGGPFATSNYYSNAAFQIYVTPELVGAVQNFLIGLSGVTASSCIWNAMIMVLRSDQEGIVAIAETVYDSTGLALLGLGSNPRDKFQLNILFSPWTNAITAPTESGDLAHYDPPQDFSSYTGSSVTSFAFATYGIVYTGMDWTVVQSVSSQVTYQLACWIAEGPAIKATAPYLELSTSNDPLPSGAPVVNIIGTGVENQIAPSVFTGEQMPFTTITNAIETVDAVSDIYYPQASGILNGAPISYEIQLRCNSGTGTIEALTDNVYAVTPGQIYTIAALVRTLGDSKSCTLLGSFTTAGNVLLSSITGYVLDQTCPSYGNYSVIWAQGVAPPGAARLKIEYSVDQITTVEDTHAITWLGVYPATAGFDLWMANTVTTATVLGLPPYGSETQYTIGETPDAWWRFDELPFGANSNGVVKVYDYAPGVGHDLTVTGLPSFGVENPFGSNIPGTAMSATTADVASFTSSYQPSVDQWAGLTLSAIMQFEVNDLNTNIAFLPGSFSLDLINGVLYWTVYATGGNGYIALSNAAINDGQPHLVEALYSSGMTGNPGLQLYVDGIEQTPYPITFNVHAPTGSFEIGSGGFTGTLCQVSLRAGAIDAAAVSARYQAVSNPPGATVNFLNPGGESTSNLIEVQFSDSETGPWTIVRFADGLSVQSTSSIGQLFVTGYDREMPPGSLVWYRARTIGREPTTGMMIISDWSLPQSITSATTNARWVLLDPLNPMTTAVAVDSSGSAERKMHEEGALFYPFGRETAIKSTDGFKGSADGQWTFRPPDVAARNLLLDLMQNEGTLLLQSPMNEQLYFQHDPSSDNDETINPATIIEHPWVDAQISVVSASRP